MDPNQPLSALQDSKITIWLTSKSQVTIAKRQGEEGHASNWTEEENL
ncbi:hypothetical protein EE612_045932 [Oryza sativa]|nr:hypothetical protein EE612_045932 [Oryza sativa]